MIFQTLLALAELNLAFFVDLILGNLFWLFAIYSIVHFFVGNRRSIWAFIVLTLDCWIISTWASMAGAVLFVGGFFLLNYISKLAVLRLSEGNKFLEPKLIWINETQAWTVFILFNFAVLMGFW